MKEAGEQIRNCLLNVDFKLDDEFGDANQLEKSWEKTPIPQPLNDVLSNVFHVDKLPMLSFPTDEYNKENLTEADAESYDDIVIHGSYCEAGSRKTTRQSHISRA